VGAGPQAEGAADEDREPGHTDLVGRGHDAAWRLAGLLAERGDLEKLRSRADAGDQPAAWHLADLLVKRGDPDGLRTRAGEGDHDTAPRSARLDTAGVIAH
jgi:hypothetical protein